MFQALQVHKKKGSFMCPVPFWYLIFCRQNFLDRKLVIVYLLKELSQEKHGQIKPNNYLSNIAKTKLGGNSEKRI